MDDGAGAVSDATISFLVLATVVVVFVWDRLPVGVVAIAAAIRGRSRRTSP